MDKPINTKLKEELWRALSVKAAEKGITKREFLEKAIANELKRG